MRYFMELAKCLNFTKAAANLYVAQPTLSQQIAELESQLGVTLFNRNSRNVTLTPAGKILQEAYPSFEAQLEQGAAAYAHRSRRLQRCCDHRVPGKLYGYHPPCHP